LNSAVTFRASIVVFIAAMFQAVLVSSLVLGGGAPDLLLVVVISLGLLRGSVPGAVCGFAGGLVLDLLTLDTLGITSLVLTLAGFWAGRYAETTGGGRRLAPLISVAVITALAAVFAFVLHYMLGEDVVARHALVTVLVPTFLLNAALAFPVHALVRGAIHGRSGLEPASEVEVVV
jgi:rod shape-determining protein MreD